MTTRALSLTASIMPAVKDIYAEWFKRGMGDQTGSGVPHGLAAMGRLPADEAWVYTCVSGLAYATAGIPLRVQVKQVTDRRTDWVDNDDVADASANALGARQLQHLLDDVNAEWDGARLQLYTEAADDLHGGSYWAKVRGRLGGPPQELHWLSAADTTPQRDTRTGAVLAYEHRPGQQSEGKDYSPRDIIAFRRFNLTDPVTIVSPLEAARHDIATLMRTAEWNANLIGNWGIPPGVFVADEKADLDPSDISAVKRALRAIRGQGGAGKIPVIPGGLTWVPLSMSQKDADWIGSGKVSRMTVCAVLGYPLVLAGDDDKASVYASIRDAERIMYRKLIPRLDARAATMDSFLVPEFDRDRRRLRIRYDYSTIEALKAPPAEEMQAWQGWVDKGVPLNYAMDYFGMPRVDGGDEPRWGGQSAQDKEKAAEARIRPAAYEVNTGQGREAVRSLGAGLYRDPAVRAWLDGGDASGLTGIVHESEVPILVEGLRRRYSAKQIADGTEGWQGLAPEDPVREPTVVNVNVPVSIAGDEAMRSHLAQRDEQMASQVGEATKTLSEAVTALRDFRFPEAVFNVPAPVVQVDVAAPTVKVAAPVIQNTMPDTMNVAIVSEPRRVQRITRDVIERIDGSVEEDA